MLWLVPSKTIREQTLRQLRDLRSPPGNPLSTLVASLVCNGGVVDSTDPVPFSPEGDARIRQELTVPQPCVAPVILLRPTAVGPYIGASG